MKLWTNVVVAGGMIGAAVLLKKLVRSRRAERIMPSEDIPPVGEDVPAVSEGVPAIAEPLGRDPRPSDEMVAVATESGLADVDPEPISQIAGEGIDLDGDIAAHQEIADLHARMPRR